MVRPRTSVTAKRVDSRKRDVSRTRAGRERGGPMGPPPRRCRAVRRRCGRRADRNGRPPFLAPGGPDSRADRGADRSTDRGRTGARSWPPFEPSGGSTATEAQCGEPLTSLPASTHPPERQSGATAAYRLIGRYLTCKLGARSGGLHRGSASCDETALRFSSREPGLLHGLVGGHRVSAVRG